jgi:hypothetical protein
MQIMDVRLGRLAGKGLILLTWGWYLILMGGCSGCACYKDDALREASAAFQYLKQGPDGSIHFETGPCKGGTGIIDFRTGAAYWIRDKVVYSVGEVARNTTPQLPEAPSDIHYWDVLEVVE